MRSVHLLLSRVEQIAAERGMTLQWDASSDDDHDHLEMPDAVSRMSPQHQPVSINPANQPSMVLVPTLGKS